MKAYKYDSETKKFIGEINRQIDPLESQEQGKEVYLMPANSTDIVPPEQKDGYDIVFNGTDWEYKEIEKPEPYEPTDEEIKQSRIWELKHLLADSDYAIIKIAEGSATHEEYADLIEQRKAWRAEINELESQSENVQDAPESGSENVQE